MNYWRTGLLVVMAGAVMLVVVPPVLAKTPAESDGDLVAIHGLGDKYRAGTNIDDDYKVGSKIGLNRGIPGRWLVQGLGEVTTLTANLTV